MALGPGFGPRAVVWRPWPKVKPRLGFKIKVNGVGSVLHFGFLYTGNSKKNR